MVYVFLNFSTRPVFISIAALIFLEIFFQFGLKPRANAAAWRLAREPDHGFSLRRVAAPSSWVIGW
jgi:hypothetical protein